MYREFFAADVAQLSHAERRAVNTIARNFYRWKGARCTVDEMLTAIADPPKVGSWPSPRARHAASA